MEGKIILTLFLGIIMLLCVLTVSASSLGTFKQDSTIQLQQLCDNCTYVNVTIIRFPNGSIDNVDKIMTKDGQDYNRTFTDTKALGMYSYTACGNLNGVTTCENIEFEVTPSGIILDTGDSILYALFCMILFGIIFGMFFFIFTMPNSNEKDTRGFEKKIVKLKYIRILFIAITYPMIILLLNLLNGLAVNFSMLSMFSGVLGFLFDIMLRLSWGFTVLMIVWIVVLLIHDTNINKQLKKFGNIRLPV